MRVTKLTKDYFETDDGKHFEHFIELDELPSLIDFQKMVDKWEKEIKEKIGYTDNE